MRKAFVLVNVDLGADNQVETELKKVERVKGVYQVYGVYDLVLEVEAESDKELKDIIFAKVRSLPHVRSTLTLSSVS